MHVRQGVVAFGLHEPVVTKQASIWRNMAVACARQRFVTAMSLRNSPAWRKELDGVGLGQDDVGGEFGLQGVGGMQRGDRGHRDLVTSSAGLGRVGGGAGRVAQRVAKISLAIEAGRLGRVSMMARALAVVKGGI